MLELSIVIPVYNVERYLRECLNSICEYYDLDIELLLIDDGSTDLSYSIIEHYKNKFSFIKSLRKSNGGQSSARNVGLNMATKKYVLFVDSDDIIDMIAVKNMVITAESKKADIVFANYFEFFDINRKKHRYDKVNFIGELILEESKLDKIFFVELSSLIGNKLYRRELLFENGIKFKEGLFFEDLDFFFHAMYYSNKIVKVDDFVYGYRQRKGSTMSNISIVYDKIIILDGIRDFLHNRGKYGYYHEKFKILYVKMFFSVILSIVKNSKTTSEEHVRILLKKTLNHYFFLAIQKEPFLYFRKLSLTERIVFKLLKYKLVNFISLLTLIKIKKLI